MSNLAVFEAGKKYIFTEEAFNADPDNSEEIGVYFWVKASDGMPVVHTSDNGKLGQLGNGCNVCREWCEEVDSETEIESPTFTLKSEEELTPFDPNYTYTFSAEKFHEETRIPANHFLAMWVGSADGDVVVEVTDSGTTGITTRGYKVSADWCIKEGK